jgi:hypothetical protein
MECNDLKVNTDDNAAIAIKPIKKGGTIDVEGRGLLEVRPNFPGED